MDNLKWGLWQKESHLSSFNNQAQIHPMHLTICLSSLQVTFVTHKASYDVAKLANTFLTARVFNKFNLKWQPML